MCCNSDIRGKNTATAPSYQVGSASKAAEIQMCLLDEVLILAAIWSQVEKGAPTQIEDKAPIKKTFMCALLPPIRRLNAGYFGISSGISNEGIMKKQHLHHIAAATLAGLFTPVALSAQQLTTSFVQAPVQNKLAPAKLSKDALEVNPLQLVKVIVQFKTANLSEQQSVITRAHGATSKQFHATKAVAAQVSGSVLQQLSLDPNVSYVSLDRPLGAKQEAPPPPPPGPVQSISKSAEYTTEPINAPAVWSQGYNGTGIGVAVIDSGIANEADLGGTPGTPLPKGQTQRVVFSESFPATLTGGTNDVYGHGTHVAGLIAGSGTKSKGKPYARTFVGVAPNANLINLRVLDENGQGFDSTVIEAIETAIELKDTYNIRVINLSLGRPIWESYQQDPLCQAVEAAWKAGIVVVVAAGNSGRNENLNPEGYGTIEAPGNDPYVITVGAMNTRDTISLGDDTIASYSSKGPSFIDNVAKPDIVAPGNLVTSLLLTGSTLSKANPTFFTPQSFYVTNGKPTASLDYMPLSGTSMATGVASGAVALLLQAQPQLTPDNVKSLMMFSAQRSYFPAVSTVVDPVTGAAYVSHYDVLTVGAGYLDIGATLNNAWNLASTLPAGTAMSPLVSYNPVSGKATLVTDQTALWGRTAVWGASNVYGQNAFSTGLSGDTALWGRTVLSGSDNPSGFTALWGTTALWGRSTPDAATALWGRSILDGMTALWGRSILDSTTALWGRQVSDSY